MSFKVVVEYLDASNGPLNHHDFGPADGVPEILLLYRPGHYDGLCR